MDIEERGWSMAGKRNFTFSFDEKKTLLIRNTIDEHAVFATQAEYMANVAEERGKNGFRTTKKPLWVYDAVYASLSRVEDTLHYINSLDLPSEGSSKQQLVYDFHEWHGSPDDFLCYCHPVCKKSDPADYQYAFHGFGTGCRKL